MHTSTITVAILDKVSQPTESEIPKHELRVEWFSGTGKGGQHRNRHLNSCRLIHIPTNIMVSSQNRSRKQSYALAYKELSERLLTIENNSHNMNIANIRKKQLGSGMRSDKIRTYRFQDNQVKDHMSGKTATMKQVMAGKFELLW